MVAAAVCSNSSRQMMPPSEAAADSTCLSYSSPKRSLDVVLLPKRSCLRRRSTLTTVDSFDSSSTWNDKSRNDVEILEASIPLEFEREEESSVATNKKLPIRRVSFSEDALVHEHIAILGDHPFVNRGPPLTIGWEVQDVYHQKVVDHVNSRKGVELRMPEDQRTKTVSASGFSQAEIRKAAHEAQKAKSQRQLSVLMVEFEGVVSVWQSAVRKFQRWKEQRDPNKCPEPAAVWLQNNATRRGNKLVLKQSSFRDEASDNNISAPASEVVKVQTQKFQESPSGISSADDAVCTSDFENQESPVHLEGKLMLSTLRAGCESCSKSSTEEDITDDEHFV